LKPSATAVPQQSTRWSPIAQLSVFVHPLPKAGKTLPLQVSWVQIPVFPDKTIVHAAALAS
jgi:hypothetical protein